MIELEFSRPVVVDRLGHEERSYDIEAGAEERSALASRFGILAVDAFSAHIRLKRLAGGQAVRVNGRFSADVVQSCVVTLEPVPAHVEEEFDLVYAPEGEDDQEEIVVALDEQDPPELIVDGIIDIGEAAAEHLALALEPFPRKPGAEFSAAKEEVSEPAKPNPFAVLASLKKK
jgi:uncharacterized metal-binding protein YceD (DUF177 family)